MYGFLILLPLTIISVLIGYFIAASPQVGDYAEYLADFANQEQSFEALRANKYVWAQLAAHLLAYIILCFTVIATVRTVSAPLPADRPAWLRFFQLFLEVVFVSLPSTVFLWIAGMELWQDWNNWILWSAVAILCVGLVLTIAVTAKRVSLNLYESFNDPFRVTITDALVVVVVVLIVATVAAFTFYPQESARAIGTFPLLMLGTTVLLLIVAAVFSRHSSPVAIISSMITIVLVLHVIDQMAPGREFRYREVALAAGSKPKPSEVKKQRNIPALRAAFHQWLEHRRPAIEEYKKKGRAYPVFFVSAQGGGVYAAYHPALALARLTDYCPEFAHHLFGISAISGGSLGAALYAELLRNVPAHERGKPASTAAECSRTEKHYDYRFLQYSVRDYFRSDFLSPVVASALLFDIPSFFIPQLRFGNDRAQALESGFESAWKDLKLEGAPKGLADDFFGRWSPSGPAPALFLSATAVNFGMPLVVSQIDWAFNPARGLVTKGRKKDSRIELVVPEAGLVKTVLDRLRRPDDELQVGVANLLDFRADVQMNVSTAVGLSARFPFVTPPATIKRNEQIDIPEGTLFQKTKVLEMTDGGFFDNSGSGVAREIVVELNRGLDRDDNLKPFKDAIQFHMIRFTDTPAKRQALASEGAHFELITPFAAYDAVRLSRGVFLASPPRTRISDVYLLDEWYEGSLNWLLTKVTRENIEKRASWVADGNTVCCEVQHPSVPDVLERIPLKKEEKEDLLRADASFVLKEFIPNADDFERVMRLMQDGIRVPGKDPPVLPPVPQ